MTKEGRVWSLVYYIDEEHSAFLKDAYHRFSSENGLNPGVFPGARSANGFTFRQRIFVVCDYKLIATILFGVIERIICDFHGLFSIHVLRGS